MFFLSFFMASKVIHFKFHLPNNSHAKAIPVVISPYRQRVKHDRKSRRYLRSQTTTTTKKTLTTRRRWSNEPFSGQKTNRPVTVNGK